MRNYFSHGALAHLLWLNWISDGRGHHSLTYPTPSGPGFAWALFFVLAPKIWKPLIFLSGFPNFPHARILIRFSSKGTRGVKCCIHKAKCIEHLLKHQRTASSSADGLKPWKHSTNSNVLETILPGFLFPMPGLRRISHTKHCQSGFGFIAQKSF